MRVALSRSKTLAGLKVVITENHASFARVPLEQLRLLGKALGGARAAEELSRSAQR